MELTWFEATQPVATLVLAHGAGAGQKSAWMVAASQALAARGIRVGTFDFPYMTAGKKVPDRAPILESAWREALSIGRDRSRDGRAFVGGKSMGGRIATQVAASDRDLPIAGLVLLGYPLHPPGRPHQRRDKHLPAIGRPMLFVQGSKDTFGTPSELAPVLEPIQPPPTVHVVEGGDHSFKLSKKDAVRQAAVYDDIQRTIVEWIGGVSGLPAGAA